MSIHSLTPEMTTILAELRQLAVGAASLESLQQKIVAIIAQRLPYYNWTGFYMLDPGDSQTLVLGPFVGDPTPHVRIPVTEGICGAAVATGETLTVDAVNADPRYLSCSIKTKSEIAFALVASLATVGGAWAVRANQFGRAAALILFGVFGLTLIFSSLAERLSRPLVALGGKLSQNSNAGPSAANSFLLGIGTGLLWAPCAGPILGLILTGAALGGASVHTVFLLLAYAAGAATSLTVALLAGGRIFAAMKRSLGVEEWIRRILGVGGVAAVAVVDLGLDRGGLARLSLASTGGLEQRLVGRFHLASQPKRIVLNQTIDVSDSATPDLSGATAWINSPSLTLASLRGKVVLIDFWTYSCINCLRTLPYIKAWNEKYKDHGLVIIGVHTPEFPFEKDESNVRKA